MARIAQIHYQRVTFSFPEKVIGLLRKKVPKNEMSKYVAKLVEEDLATKADDWESFIASLSEFRENLVRDDKRDSLEILREIRYGKN